MTSPVTMAVSVWGLEQKPQSREAGCKENSFVDKVPSKYYCNICSKVLKDARLTVCCGQHYCHSCLARWSSSATQRKKKTCPHCRKEEFESVLNKAMIREINEFRVRCRHHERGCGWVGELGGLAKHITSDDGCGYELVICKNSGFVRSAKVSITIKCDETCERQSLTDHYKTCKYRRYKCEYCDRVDTYDAIAGSGKKHLRPGQVDDHPGSNHHAVCGHFPLKCPNKCGKTDIKRSDMASHRKLCPLEPINCPFKYVGCSSKFPHRDMESHCETSTQAHLLLIVESHNELARKNEELVRKNEEVMQRLQTHEEVMQRLQALEKRVK